MLLRISSAPSLLKGNVPSRVFAGAGSTPGQLCSSSAKPRADQGWHTHDERPSDGQTRLGWVLWLPRDQDEFWAEGALQGSG